MSRNAYERSRYNGNESSYPAIADVKRDPSGANLIEVGGLSKRELIATMILAGMELDASGASRAHIENAVHSADRLLLALEADVPVYDPETLTVFHGDDK